MKDARLNMPRRPAGSDPMWMDTMVGLKGRNLRGVDQPAIAAAQRNTDERRSDPGGPMPPYDWEARMEGMRAIEIRERRGLHMGGAYKTRKDMLSEL